MIQSFKHKGLQKFFETGSKKGINPEHAKKLKLQLDALHGAVRVANMDVPGWDIHPLKHWGDDLWAVKVTGNWRLTFKFSNEDAHDVDYLDYH